VEDQSYTFLGHTCIPGSFGYWFSSKWTADVRWRPTTAIRRWREPASEFLPVPVSPRRSRKSALPTGRYRDAVRQLAQTPGMYAVLWRTVWNVYIGLGRHAISSDQVQRNDQYQIRCQRNAQSGRQLEHAISAMQSVLLHRNLRTAA
jgi:hypothetical protein